MTRPIRDEVLYRARFATASRIASSDSQIANKSARTELASLMSKVLLPLPATGTLYPSAVTNGHDGRGKVWVFEMLAPLSCKRDLRR